MKIHKLNILFLVAKNRIRRDGKAPLFCRLTYLEKRKQFATGFFIIPNEWNKKNQCLEPTKEENIFMNTQISLIKQRVNQAFLLIQLNHQLFSVNDIYAQYKGEKPREEKTLLQVFELHNSKMKKLIGKEYTQSTFSKFKEAKSHVLRFLRFQYKVSDIELKNLKLKFIEDFDFYLKTEKNQKQVTINKSIQRVRKIVKLAIAEGFLERDPFILYQPKKYETKVVFLSSDELKALEGYSFAQSRLGHVRDMFVFCCYTGLAYQEMASLKPSDIITGFDDRLWIKMKRKKTKNLLSIPLLPKALKILEKYKNDGEMLPVISNQKFNSYLKEIALIVGIDKRITHHVARKTFATTILLYNGVSMEIVSELLGHSNMKITQTHYGKVVQEKVSETMLKLKDKLDKK